MKDLKNTIWYIPPGWKAEARTGVYFLECYIDDKLTDTLHIGYNGNIDSFDALYLNEESDIISYRTSEASLNKIYGDAGFSLYIVGGSDSQNASLIDWLSKYGEQQQRFTMSRSATPTSDYAEIVYQDSIIAEVESGKIITLACNNTRITSDLIIRNRHLETTPSYETLNVEIKYDDDTLLETLAPGKQARIPAAVRFLSDIVINVLKDIPQSNLISASGEVIITSDNLIFKVKE